MLGSVKLHQVPTLRCELRQTEEISAIYWAKEVRVNVTVEGIFNIHWAVEAGVAHESRTRSGGKSRIAQISKTLQGTGEHKNTIQHAIHLVSARHRPCNSSLHFPKRLVGIPEENQRE